MRSQTNLFVSLTATDTIVLRKLWTKMHVINHQCVCLLCGLTVLWSGADAVAAFMCHVRRRLYLPLFRTNECIKDKSNSIDSLVPKSVTNVWMRNKRPFPSTRHDIFLFCYHLMFLLWNNISVVHFMFVDYRWVFIAYYWRTNKKIRNNEKTMK